MEWKSPQFVLKECGIEKNLREFFIRKKSTIENLLNAARNRQNGNDEHRRKKRRDASKKDIRRSQLPNFEIGTYVLEALVDKPTKLRLIWRGPKIIVGIENEWVYWVEDLITRRKKKAHATHLKLYADKDRNLTADMLQHARHHAIEYTIEKILQIRVGEPSTKPENYEVEIAWEGFEPEDNSWEPLETILEDAKEIAEDFLRETAQGKGKMASTAKAAMKRFKVSLN